MGFGIWDLGFGISGGLPPTGYLLPLAHIDAVMPTTYKKAAIVDIEPADDRSAMSIHELKELH